MEALTTNRGLEYFDRQGLRTTTGLPENRWNEAILKELLDNALDAIDPLDEKRITITVGPSTLTIQDSGGGIPPDALENVYDFNVFLSSKRDYCIPTRGAQGNALKTIIGISTIENYDLSFHTQGNAISYRIDRALLRTAQIPKFAKIVQQNGDLSSAVVVDFHDEPPYILDDVKDLIFKYSICNPDVSFLMSTPHGDKEFLAVCPIQKRGFSTFLHWYTFEAFETLLQKHVAKDPEKTVKTFCSIFSGTQRVLSKLDFPYKRLNEFRHNLGDIETLYEGLKELTKEPSPHVLMKHAIGKPQFLKKTGTEDSKNAKYKRIVSAVSYEGAHIPYIIEAFYYPSHGPFRYITSINNSIPYHHNAFKISDKRAFSRSRYRFCDKPLFSRVYDLEGVFAIDDIPDMLQNRTLLINFICPIKGFGVTDKSKNYVIADAFFQDILDVISHVMKSDVKKLRNVQKKQLEEAEKAQRQYEKQQKQQEMHGKQEYKNLKNQLPKAKHALSDFFDWALDREEKEGNKTSTARRLFYVIRDHVNKLYRDVLKCLKEKSPDPNKEEIFGKSSYKTFTQEILTEKFHECPELKKRVLLSARGFVYDHTIDQTLYLGGKEAFEITQKEYLNRARDIASIHPKWRFNSAVYVEKSTVFDTLKNSGIVEELNFLLICGQGFSTRAIKDVLSLYNDHDMLVYILSDCDISGYNIAYTLQNPTKTYDSGINATRIGLTVEQVEAFGLEYEPPQTRKNNSKYTDTLRRLTDYEYNHLVADAEKGEYRRVELDVVSNQQLFTLLRDAIKPRKILPDQKTLFGAFGYREILNIRVDRVFAEFFDQVISEFYKEFSKGILSEKTLKRCARRKVFKKDKAGLLDEKYRAKWIDHGKNTAIKFDRHADRMIRRNIKQVFSKQRNIDRILELFNKELQKEE